MPPAAPGEVVASASAEPTFQSHGPYHMDPRLGLTLEDGSVSLWISAPFTVVAEGFQPTRGTGWGLLLEWRDGTGEVRRGFVPDEALHVDRAKICGKLAHAGLRISPSAAVHFADYLTRCRSVRRITLFD
jgi:hypothetical protein